MLLLIVLGFAFLIFIHELGHFLAAKAVGIRATQFAIGFGTPAVAWRKGIGLRWGRSTEREYRQRAYEALGYSPDAADDEAAKQVDADGEALDSEHTPAAEPGALSSAAVAEVTGLSTHEPPDDRVYAAADRLGLGETEYRLNWLPLGGYVKMLGQEDLDPNARSQDPRAFTSKGFWAKTLVISAGVIMNLITGALFLLLAFSPFGGVPQPTAVIGDVAPGSPAGLTAGYLADAEAPVTLGLRPGDRVLRVNGEPALDLMKLQLGTALAPPDTDVQVEVERSGFNAPLRFDIRPEANDRADGMLAAGVRPAVSLEARPAEGETSGDRIEAVDDTPVGSISDLYQAMTRDPLATRTLRVVRPDGTHRNVEHRVRLDVAAAELEGRLLGLRPALALQVSGPATSQTEPTPAEAAGLRDGDVVANIGGVAWPDFEALVEVVTRSDGAPIAVEVIRDGVPVKLEGLVAPRSANRFGLPVGPRRIGVGPERVRDPLMIRGVADDSPLAGAGLRPGSVLLAVGEVPVERWGEVAVALADAAASEAEAVELTFNVAVGAGSRETLSVPLDDATRTALLNQRWELFPIEGFADRTDERPIRGSTFTEAAGLAVGKTGEFVQQTYLTLARLFQGTVQVRQLRGPVGILDEGQKISRRGWTYYLFFLGIISVNLAVLNFLPLPIVDGGLMLFNIYESIRGQPAPVWFQNATTLAGLALLGTMFLVVTGFDLGRLFF